MKHKCAIFTLGQGKDHFLPGKCPGRTRQGGFSGDEHKALLRIQHVEVAK